MKNKKAALNGLETLLLTILIILLIFIVWWILFQPFKESGFEEYRKNIESFCQHFNMTYYSDQNGLFCIEKIDDFFIKSNPVKYVEGEYYFEEDNHGIV